MINSRWPLISVTLSTTGVDASGRPASGSFVHADRDGWSVRFSPSPIESCE
jgi:hypothetical protein